MTAFAHINEAWNWLEDKHRDDPEGRMAVARARIGTDVRVREETAELIIISATQALDTCLGMNDPGTRERIKELRKSLGFGESK